MAKRRRQRKFLKLTPLQKVALLWGGQPGAFESDLQARAAWLRHREELLAGFIPGHPGRRPRAFWRFEWRGPERDPTCGDDWPLLLEAGEIGEEERTIVLAQWLRTLEQRKGHLQNTHDHYRRGWVPIHGAAWPELSRKYEREATLLGEMAIKTWAAIRDGVISAWEDTGCGGCTAGFVKCNKVSCKHYEKHKTREVK